MGKNHWYNRGRLQGLFLVFSHFSFCAPNSRSERFLPLMSHRRSYMLNRPKSLRQVPSGAGGVRRPQQNSEAECVFSAEL